MNSVCLIGNLALDPELKKTNSGKDVSTIRIGVTRSFKNEQGVRESDFVNVQCWEATARFVSKFLQKGDRVAVTGEIRERSYTAQDGQKRYTIEVLATRVESLSRKGDGSGAEEKAQNGFTEVVDDGLPF